MQKDTESYQNSQLYKIRHTAAHVLAMAMLEWDPLAKLAIGPPIEHGFYYDFELTKPFGDEQLPELQKTMQKIINQNIAVEHKLIDKKEAIKLLEKNNQEFKIELATNLEDDKLSFYGIGQFWDLCKGPHVKSTGEINAFKLLNVAGAYWRGSEANAMLTRIYGTAFENKKDLETYLHQLDEAKKRDHKILGPKLGLFTFSDLVGAGLPLWTPKGTVLRNLLDDFVWQLRQEQGFEKVEIPHIAKRDLYEKSGHWEKFKDDLFVVQTREGHEFVMKPMNCPHHTQIYKAELRSYRDLPIRYANTTMVYRDEQTGELAGLSRVRSITQDDAHIFCRMSQMEVELNNTWGIVDKFYSQFGFKLEARISLRDESQKEKYLGSDKVWVQAENLLRKVARNHKLPSFEAIGEAAFYGPKIDFMAADALGRQLQVATLQLDFNLPERFDLYCINEKGEQERIVMIHAAIMGSIERFISILIEHYAGEFPFWLAPTQVGVLPISEKFEKYAKELAHNLQTAGFRTQLNDSAETLGKRIRVAETQKIPHILVVGEREQAEKTVSLRERGKIEQKTLLVQDYISFAQSLGRN